MSEAQAADMEREFQLARQEPPTSITHNPHARIPAGIEGLCHVLDLSSKLRSLNIRGLLPQYSAAALHQGSLGRLSSLTSLYLQVCCCCVQM
jgi:hypothetical protein